MASLPNKLVAETFGLTLEALAFVSLLPPEVPAAAPEEAMLLRLSLTQTDTMVLELVAGRPFGQLLAGNLLGIAPDDPEIQLRYVDALKELVNVAGGALLGLTLEHDAEPPEMSIPEVQSFTATTDWPAFIGVSEACVFSAEGNTIAFRIRGAA
jgi:hypothetical protein